MPSPREVLLTFHAAFVARDIEALCALYHPDVVNHQVAEEPQHGIDAVRAGFEAFFRDFPDERTEILNVFEDGEWAIWEWRGGSSLKEAAGIPQRPFHGCGFFLVRDGRIAFQRGYWDKLTFLSNHGLRAEPESTTG